MQEETRAVRTPDGLAGGVSSTQENKAGRQSTRGRYGARDWLANDVLGHLPLAVAVIDAASRLLFWNERAAGLFGVPSLMAAEKPALGPILAGVPNLTPRQRDRVLGFASASIAAGNQAEPDSCLRLSLGPDRRIAIQARGLGAGRWMLVIDEGKTFAAASPGRSVARDAWLDALTGLGNRRHFNQVLREALDNATPETHHAVLMIDLDRFNLVNDRLGHHVGDALLRLAAERLRRDTRNHDALARLGGDEFALLIPNGGTAEAVAARMVESLSRPFQVEGDIVTIGASVGIARFPEHGTSADDLMRRADLALHEAKAGGRGTWRMFGTEMATRAAGHRETDPRTVLALDHSSLDYRLSKDPGVPALPH
ncbi:MAG: sensor domain-containing diguanylate cyclase [Rhodopila sp.]|nr:sensor domain-containing diguanylate cyclase [Rhodopila sp.]